MCIRDRIRPGIFHLYAPVRQTWKWWEKKPGIFNRFIGESRSVRHPWRVITMLYRGMIIGLPISIALWVMLITAIRMIFFWFLIEQFYLASLRTIKVFNTFWVLIKPAEISAGFFGLKLSIVSWHHTNAIKSAGIRSWPDNWITKANKALCKIGNIHILRLGTGGGGKSE